MTDFQLHAFSKTKMSDIEGFILAEGASNLIRRDKAALLIDGFTFLERAAFAVKTTAPPRLSIVGNHRETSLPFPCLPDNVKKNSRASIIGLHTILRSH